MITVSLAVEGPLDEQVLRRLIGQCAGEHLIPGVCYVQNGRDRLRQNAPRFQQAARGQPFILLADLDRDECAPALVRAWLPGPRHPNLVLRIAVRMVESWLLADRQASADFLGVPLARLPERPDEEADPKLLLVNLARRSRQRLIREDLVPAAGSTSRVGKNYNDRVTQFILEGWNASRAGKYSPSLNRTQAALQAFNPTRGGEEYHSGDAG